MCVYLDVYLEIVDDYLFAMNLQQNAVNSGHFDDETFTRLIYENPKLLFGIKGQDDAN